MVNKLLELLEPTAVFLDLEVTDSRAVIQKLGDSLYEAGYVRETFVGAALAREEQLPTGLPLGGEINAAIPHTDVEHVKKPGLAMATLARPVVFQNMVDIGESVQVRLVFLLSLDQPKAQIEMLQEIAGVLQNSEVVSRLIEAKTYEDVCKSLSSV
jgi:PTS system galactitol-specific IIA component